MNEVTYYRAIDLLSHTGGTTIQGLQEELSVSRRTVYRLLDRLQDQGFPIYDEESADRKKRWKLEEDYLKRLPNTSFPDLMLDREEMILLNIMLGKETTLSESGYNRVLKSLRHKLTRWMEAGSLNDADVNRSSRYISSIKSGRKCYLGSEKILDDLISAISSRLVCSTRYFAFSKQRELELDIRPIHIFEWKRGLYVFCLMEPGLVPRMLAIERFNHLLKTEKRFEKPEVDPEDLLDKAFAVTWNEPIRARVRFSKESAPYVKARRWATDQQFHDNEDGSTELTLTTSGIGDVVHWILGFGSGAEVLEPASLINGVKKNLESALEYYNKP